MESKDFKLEFEIGAHSYRVEGVAYYEDEADDEVGYFERNILRVFVESCEIYVEEGDIWVRKPVTNDIVDEVWSILEDECSDW